MREVKATILIRSTPERVIDAFLQPEALQGWWAVQRSLVQPRPGGTWTLAWNITEAGFQYITTGIIEVLSPGEYLRIGKMVYLNPTKTILGPMQLDISAQPAEEGQVLLSVTQSGYQQGEDWDWYYEAVLAAWPYALDLLKKYLEQGAAN